MTLCCQQDDRRDAVRRMDGRNGLDYVEVHNDQVTLDLFFLGRLPEQLRKGGPDAASRLRVEGGERITGIQVTSAEAFLSEDPEQDDMLTITVSMPGDFSTYAVRLVNVDNIDPRYESAQFSFKVNCPSDLDCAASCACETSAPHEPEINYLAKDYGSFRQLLLDRLAVLMPEWRERHAADLGIALVEVLAYTADYLSYYQDAVATEAYLETARQRISVRRHTRLADYTMHEGCNARAFVCLEVSSDMELAASGASLVTGMNDALPAKQTVLTWDDLSDTPVTAYEVFEPISKETLQFRTAHNEIRFFTWGLKECCLAKGATSAELLDGSEGERSLSLQAGDVLIFEEVVGARTGLPADADLKKRHAVRLTSVTPGSDPVTGAVFVTIAWAAEDALPFTLCISTIGSAPDCRYLENVSVARGNVVLVDHGYTQPPEDLGAVPALRTESACECVNEAGDVQTIPGKFRPYLRKLPLTWREPLGSARSASATLKQDVRNAAPQVWVTSTPPAQDWAWRYDMIASGSADCHHAVEIDNDGIARLRFGNGECGAVPQAGCAFSAIYRTGNGAAGNVGPESISRLVLKDRLDGVSVSLRNPLPATGGTNPEPVTEAKLMAPTAFRKYLERAITADDYETVAERNPTIQLASADMVWTGSWYEVDVAVDPLGRAPADAELMERTEAWLERYRRMGHDLRVGPALYVPIDLALEVCALPGYDRGQLKRVLLDVFSTRVLPGGKRGFFHPDNLTFGEGIYLSRIIAAAQEVTGVECVTVARFQRLFEAPNNEIENGVLPLKNSEIARLDNNPTFPERGKLEITVKGGR